MRISFTLNQCFIFGIFNIEHLVYFTINDKRTILFFYICTA